MPESDPVQSFLSRLTGQANVPFTKLTDALPNVGGNDRTADLIARLAGGGGPAQRNVEESRRRHLTDAENRETPRPPKPQDGGESPQARAEALCDRLGGGKRGA
jgi:hypothetical protein